MDGTGGAAETRGRSRGEAVGQRTDGHAEQQKDAEGLGKEPEFHGEWVMGGGKVGYSSLPNMMRSLRLGSESPCVTVR